MSVQPGLIITGASKGIGRATAALFVERGYRVMNLSRTDPELAGVEHVSIDLAASAWAPAATAAATEFAALCAPLVLIHNAARLDSDTVGNVEPEAMRATLELNVVAAIRLNQLLLSRMGQGSAIVYIGSTLGEKAVANTCSYVVSKHALIGLMRATCQDLAGTGIHTACVCPGFTDTEMLRAHTGESSEVLKSIAGGVTMGRLIEPGEIANTLLFAAQNPVINGAVLHANLGQIEH